MASLIALRQLTNDRDVIDDPTEDSIIFAGDWDKLIAALQTANSAINPAEVWIDGTPRLLDTGGASLSECLPDADGTRALGTGVLRWNAVHAISYYGDGSGLTGTPPAPHVHSAADITSGILLAARGGTDVGAPSVGDLLTGDQAAPGAWKQTSIGSAGTYLRSNGTIPRWWTLDVDDVGSGTLAAAYGGTGFSAMATQDLLVGAGGNTWAKLPIGSEDDVLQVKSGAVSWEAATFLSVSVRQNIPFRITPPGNGLIDIVGWYEQTDTAAALSSASPLTVGIEGFNSSYALNISAAVGLPFTVRFTGRSVDQTTDIETPGDTEDIAVTANGWYRTTKYWIDDPVVSIVEATKSCTVDVYRFSAIGNPTADFTITGMIVEWLPSGGVWSINVELDEVTSDGSLSSIDSVTFASTDAVLRASNGVTGGYWRRDYDHVITAGAGFILSVDQTTIDHFFVAILYDWTGA